LPGDSRICCRKPTRSNHVDGRELPHDFLNFPIDAFCSSLNLQIVYSPWDFSLLFTRAVPSEIHQEESEFGARFRVEAVPQFVETLVVSPQHAKAMLKALDQNIRAYENDHDEIAEIEPPSAPSAPPASGADPSQEGTE